MKRRRAERSRGSESKPWTCGPSVMDGRPFIAYRMIEGSPLGAAQQGHAAAVGQMLGELHSFPVDRAAALLGAPAPQNAWREYYEGLWPLIERAVLPELDRATADVVRERYTRMIERPPEFPVSLVHNDLGPVHVLVTSERPVGIIDFENAWVGDPAAVIAPLAAHLGPAAIPQLTGGRDLGGALETRLAFYHWMGSIHAIIFGVREDNQRERAAGVRELRRRLQSS